MLYLCWVIVPGNCTVWLIRASENTGSAGAGMQPISGEL